MFGRRSGTKTKVAPTHYPRLPFHGLRTAQFVSSLVVGAVMFYFDWHLRHDHWGIPWTFIVLTAVACLTILSLAATIVLHCCFGLNPRFNLALNSLLLGLWGLGLGLLTWRARDTLGHACTLEKWRSEQGVMVCQIYKALFTFSMTGTVSTIAALGLDIWVFKRATARGKYDAMRDGNETKRAFSASYRDSEDIARESVEIGPLASSTRAAGPQGRYEIPREQFDQDTGYRGGAAH